jgi:hypothetical protein
MWREYSGRFKNATILSSWGNTRILPIYRENPVFSVSKTTVGKKMLQ